MTGLNPIKDQLIHITVDFDAQGRLILDNQGKKYLVTVESTDTEGHTTPLALQQGATTNKIKTLLAGLIKAHVLHDQEPSDMRAMNAQGLSYENGVRHHNFTMYDGSSAHRKEATEALVKELAPHLEGSYATELLQAQTVWNRLENLVQHSTQSTPALTPPSSLLPPPPPPSPTASDDAFPSTPQEDPMKPINTRSSLLPPPPPPSPTASDDAFPSTPQEDPMKPINTRSSPLPPSPPLSPQPNSFDDADEEIVADLTIDLPPADLAPQNGSKVVRFVPIAQPKHPQAHGPAFTRMHQLFPKNYTSTHRPKDHTAKERREELFPKTFSLPQHRSRKKIKSLHNLIKN